VNCVSAYAELFCQGLLAETLLELVPEQHSLLPSVHRASGSVWKRDKLIDRRRTARGGQR
jgi:chromosome condensin MukBEF MukE localization factor